MRRKTIVKETRPRSLKIARWICRAKRFLNELWSFDFRPTEQCVEQFDF